MRIQSLVLVLAPLLLASCTTPAPMTNSTKAIVSDSKTVAKETQVVDITSQPMEVEVDMNDLPKAPRMLKSNSKDQKQKVSLDSQQTFRALQNIGDNSLADVFNLNNQEEDKTSTVNLLQTSTDNEQRPAAIDNMLKKHHDNCEVDLAVRASALSAVMIEELMGRYQGPVESVYVAPTIIPEKYSDCITSLDGDIKNAISETPKLQLVDNVNLAPDSLSASSIPSIIKAARKNNIQYIVISMVREQVDVPMLSIKIIKVQNSITISQSYKRI